MCTKDYIYTDTQVSMTFEFYFQISKMIYFIQLFIYLIFLLNKSNAIKEDILLFNDLSYNSDTSYTVVSTNKRIKRDQLSWTPSDIEKNQMSCGSDVYTKLSACSLFGECG